MNGRPGDREQTRRQKQVEIVSRRPAADLLRLSAAE
jgi:hypothetical protein